MKKCNWQNDALYYAHSCYVGINDTVKQLLQFALDTYCMGPQHYWAEKEIDPGYYVACGNFFILLWTTRHGLICSAKQAWLVQVWSHTCFIYSATYEIYRAPQLRGIFGMFELNAAVLMFAPQILILVTLLGTLNLMIMRRMLKAANEGPMQYHLVEVGCDILSAIFNIFPYMPLGLLVNAFTG